MPESTLGRTLAIALASGTALSMSTAEAVIDLPGGDSFLDGSFQGMSYGAGGVATLAPRLFVGEFGSTLPPFDQVLGTGLEFSYDAPSFSAERVDFRYRLTNNDPGGAFTDLRFILDLNAVGAPGVKDLPSVVGFGVPGTAGEAAQFQVFDFDAPGDRPLQRIESSNALNGGIDASCAAGCVTDLALQFDRAELQVGDTWEIVVSLLDDPALVTGGRYLAASSLGPDGNTLVFGHPTLVPVPAALVLFATGLSALSCFNRRSRRNGTA